jgi:hypothetical protein
MTTQNITSLTLNTPSMPVDSQQAAMSRPAGPTPYALGVQLMLVSPADEQRSAVEQFIQQQYRQHYAAQLNEFFPIILAVREMQSGRLMGAVGLRYADEQPLFSEQYLGQSIESSIADKEQLNVTRHSIIELGHFAVAQPVDVNTVIPLIGRFLKSLDVSWAVYTLSRPIKVAFARLGIQLTHLQHAHQGSLQGHPSDWGRYYDFKPAVYYSSILNNMNAK